MTKDEASTLRAAHDTDATLLSRKPKHELVAIHQSEGNVLGPSGHWSKDELIAGILRARGFGIERLNEASHVLGHGDALWPDCPHCTSESFAAAQPASHIVPTGTGWPVTR